MTRSKIDPALHGISMSPDDFMDQMVTAFADSFHGTITLDELLLSPKDALTFCDSVRARYGYRKLPDSQILRAIMQRRKNPQ